VSLLGIDLGTSGVRAAAFTEAGEPLAEHAVPTALTRDGALVETYAEGVLTAVFEAVAQVASSPAVLTDGVTALSFSVQGEAVVPVDSAGRAIAPAPVSMDRRGTHAASAIGDRLGHATFQRITGQPLHPMFSVFKIAAGRPGWGVEAAGYRTLDAFVAARLGADAVADYSIAARTGAFDVEARAWSEEVLAAAGSVAGFPLSADRLPAVAAPGTVIGTLDAAAADRTGLAAGTPIVAGAHDQAASFLGAGGRTGGPAVFALGSSDCLTVLTGDRPDLTGTGFACYPVADGAWITLAGTAAGGWALEWLSGFVGQPIDELFAETAETPPALLVLPYLAGSGTLDNDPLATGVVAGLTLDTSRAEVARAFLESTGYELAKIRAAFESRGVAIGAVRAVGTGAANASALGIRASAAGVAVHPVAGQASARGAALLAGLGTGVFGSIHDLPDAPTGPPALPEERHADWYARQRRRFGELYTSTSPTLHSLTTDKENHR